MAWRKSPQSLIDLFDGAVPTDPRLERRKMFGYPAAFVNGNMCMGLHQEDFIVRLSPEDRDEIKATHGAVAFEPMKGRAMREYVALPADILDDSGRLADWVGRSFAFVSGMPPKEKKPRKSTARKSAAK
jgi:TfoX/Sxy family transcriptional regulator of competence genes